MTPEKLAEFLEQQKRGNWIRTHELRRLQMKFPPWLWDACNNALEDDMNAGDRSYALNRVFNPVMATLPRYPIRPTVLLQPSPSIDALRSVLARAPDCANMYKDNFTGIDMTDHWNGAITYSWSNSYLDDLFNACIGVIREHGVGDSGWRTIRWEVYDMVRPLLDISCTSIQHVFSPTAFSVY